MYAYAQKGVEHVDLQIDMDEADGGESPSVTYMVRLDPGAKIKWSAVKKAKTIKNGIAQKLALLALMKAGAPIHIESSIKILARGYLPERFSVEVKIVE